MIEAKGRLLTCHEVADLFGVSEPTVWRWARGNNIPGIVRLGQRLRFDPSAIAAHIAGGGRPVPPDNKPRAA